MKQTNEELKTQRERDLNTFKEVVKSAKNKIFVVLKGVSRSGMLRQMDFYTFTPNNRGGVDKFYLNYFIAEFLNYSRDKNNGRIKVGGCGMDMAFSVVYNIGRFLYPNGDGVTITGRNGDKEPETDGGYLMDYEVL